MPVPLPTFRIFVSSTFTDLVEERNALHQSVFPALKKLCQDHGSRFQAIDLRWGVRDEAALDHQTMRICLEEVRRCQEVTPKPNFLILLGNRYGWRPLPPEIPAGEWDRIAAHLSHQGEDGLRKLARLEEWYTLDRNAAAHANPPGAWLLASRAAHERGTDRYQSSQPGSPWMTEVEAPLLAILQDAVSQLDFDPEARLKYGGSSTEQEIFHGALSAAAVDPEEHVFCFFRNIAGLPEDARARDYRDLVPAPGSDPVTGPKVADSQAERRLGELKDTRLPARLPPGHFFRYEATWLPLPPSLSAEAWQAVQARLGEEIARAREQSDAGALAGLEELERLVGSWYEPDGDGAVLKAAFQNLGVEERIEIECGLRQAVFYPATPDRPGRSPISQDHLPRLCQDVERVLREVIRGAIDAAQERKKREQITELDEEVAAHERFARERLRSRRDPDRSVFVGRASALDRIARYLEGGGARALALTGEPGSGKSAVVAQATLSAGAEHPDAQVISRFIGWTPASSTVRELLDGLCRQIARAYGGDEATPSDYRELVQEFPKRLALATPDRPLFVFLDALDQLGEADSARDLVWLPLELPAQVRLVVSSSTEPGDTCAVLERRLPAEHRFSLDDMPVADADRLLRHWFADAGRTLQGQGTSHEDAAGQWLRVLEAFRACPRPLYLKLAFEEARRWRSFDPIGPEALAPAIDRIIQQLFARLSDRRAGHGKELVESSLGYLMAARNGLSEDEIIDVLSRDPMLLRQIRKYHRPPEERLPVVVWSRFYFDLEPYLTQRRADETSLFAFYHRQLEQEARRQYRTAARHHALAEYFAERDRIVDGKKVPSLRKLSELPYQQTEAGDMWNELYHTLTDFDFLEAKCTYVAVTTEGSAENARKVYGGVYELQEDYRRALSAWPAEEPMPGSP